MASHNHLMPSAELVIELSSHNGYGHYTVTLHFDLPDLDVSAPDLLNQHTPEVVFDLARLAGCEHDSLAYGTALGEMLFADPQLLVAIARARTAAGDGRLRLRIHLPLTATVLHNLMWETLRLPGEDQFLAHSDRVLLSRYHDSTVLGPTRPCSVGSLSALIAVANPCDLEDYGATAIDVKGEIDRARTALGAGVGVRTLGDDAPASLVAIDSILSGRHPPAILYLVCHGSLEKGVPFLWLQDQDGCRDLVRGEDFAANMRLFSRQPYLVVLASCESGGSARLAGSNSLAAIGPRLIASGVPAVIAMQGKVPVATLTRLMPDFFAELRSHGMIDLALASARRRIAAEHEWWAPVLYMRLKSGRLFTLPRPTAKGGPQPITAQPNAPNGHLPAMSREERERVNRILFDYTWSLPTFDLGRYSCDDTSRRHILSTKLCHHNPFKFLYAEDEFPSPGGFNLYWPEHPCTLKLEQLVAPTVVYGKSGTGKTAASAYLYRRLMISASPRKKYLCVLLPAMTDERAILFRAAQDVTRLALHNITHMSDNEHAANLLAGFLVEMLGLQFVLKELAAARQAHASSSQAADAQDIKQAASDRLFDLLEDRAQASARSKRPKIDWLLQLNEVALALGLQGFRFLFDNITAADLRPYAGPLRRLYGSGVGLTLFTGVPDCVDTLEIMGFVPQRLVWSETQVLDAARYRVNTLCRRLKSAICPHLVLDDLTADDLRSGLFDREAWAVVQAQVDLCPRTLFRVLSYAIENPLSPLAKISRTQIEGALS